MVSDNNFVKTMILYRQLKKKSTFIFLYLLKKTISLAEALKYRIKKIILSVFFFVFSAKLRKHFA